MYNMQGNVEFHSIRMRNFGPKLSPQHVPHNSDREVCDKRVFPGRDFSDLQANQLPQRKFYHESHQFH